MSMKALATLLFLPLLGAGSITGPDGSGNDNWNNASNDDLNAVGSFGDGWIYVYFPGFGNFSLGDSTTEGTFAFDLFQAYGGSFDEFEYVLMKTFSPSDHNGGVIVFMPRIDDSVCVADFNSDGVLDLFDVLDFLEAYDAEDLDADIDQSGSVDVFDLFGFLGGFSVGC